MFLRRRTAAALPRAAVAVGRLPPTTSSLCAPSASAHHVATIAATAAAAAALSGLTTTRDRRAVQLMDCTVTQRRHAASQATDTTAAGSVATSAAAESPVASLAGVPTDVVQRIIGQHQTMRRLLRLAAGHAAVPLKSMEEVFERQIGLGPGGAKMSPSSAAAAGTDRNPSVSRHLLSTAIWRVLQHDCYFARTQVPNSTDTAAAASDVSEHDLCVVPLSWRAVLERLAANIPYEGWTESEVQAHLQTANPIWATFPPLWLPAYGSGATSFPVFVRQHFPTLLTITRSAVTGELLFHRTGHNSVAVTWWPRTAAGAETEHVAGRSNEVCDAVQHALHTLGRGHQLPLWTDVATVAPLLPVQTGLSRGGAAAWHAAFVQHAELRGCFRLEAYVRVRAASSSCRWTVVVDSTTLTPADVTALLAAAAARMTAAGAAGAAASVKLLRRAGTPREAYEQACCAAAGPATLVHDVVVDALLEPQHLLAALVESVVAELEEPEAAAATTASETTAATPAPDVEGGEAAAEDVDAPAEGGRGDEDDEETATPTSSPSTAAAASADASATPVLVLCGASAKAAFAAVLEDVRSPLVAVSVVTPVADA